MYVYRKIPIISPGLIFVQKAFLLGLFSEGAFYWKEFCVSKWVWLSGNKNSLKQLKTASTNSPWAYSGGLIIGRIFASEIWGAYFREGLFFGRAYYRNFTVYDGHPSHAREGETICRCHSKGSTYVLSF